MYTCGLLNLFEIKMFSFCLKGTIKCWVFQNISTHPNLSQTECIASMWHFVSSWRPNALSTNVNSNCFLCDLCLLVFFSFSFNLNKENEWSQRCRCEKFSAFSLLPKKKTVAIAAFYQKWILSSPFRMNTENQEGVNPSVWWQSIPCMHLLSFLNALFDAINPQQYLHHCKIEYISTQKSSLSIFIWENVILSTDGYLCA